MEGGRGVQREELRNVFTEGFLAIVYSSSGSLQLCTTHDTPIVGLGTFAWLVRIIPFTSIHCCKETVNS